MAFAEETSRFPLFEVTKNLLTNVGGVRNFVDRDIAIDGAIGQPGVVRIAAQSVIMQRLLYRTEAFMSETDLAVPVAHWTACTEAEGPGKRFALWLQGCPMRCPGCCNPEMLSFTGGTPAPLHEILCLIDRAQSAHEIEGVTLLGGEPLAHGAASAAIAVEAQKRGLSVMVFTGYTIEEARNLPDPRIAELLSATDILVDGRYEQNLPDHVRRWIGSTNQRIHFLSARYKPDDPCWTWKNTIEIRLKADVLSVNGFPAEHAVGLWKDLPKAKANRQ